MPLPENWVDNIGMQVNAVFLNSLDDTVNTNTDDIIGLTTDLAAVAARIAKGGHAAAAELIPGATYTDMPSAVTDTCTVTVGASGIVLVFLAFTLDSGATGNPFMSFAVSGAAGTIAADDSRSLTGSANSTSYNKWIVVSGLTPEATGTFKAKYRRVSGTVTLSNRYIAAFPLG